MKKIKINNEGISFKFFFPDIENSIENKLNPIEGWMEYPTKQVIIQYFTLISAFIACS